MGKAQKFLKENPHIKEVYSTSDNFLFFKKQDAKVHATTLKNTAIEKHSIKTDDSAEGSLEDELAGLELVPKNYGKMKSIANALQLEVKGNKAEDYIKALEEYKTKAE